jgi:hypothetical protein
MVNSVPNIVAASEYLNNNHLTKKNEGITFAHSCRNQKSKRI